VASDRYETLARPSHVEIPRIKGSRFIADAMPVESQEDAEREVEAVRKRYHDATHHCYGYRFGVTGEPYRSSDDGEPSGSAGAPILRQIEASGLSDVLVVVTRYFGGTKLGTGGLVRAYGEAASQALRAGRRRTRRLYGAFALSFSYDDTSPVMRLLDRFEARIIASKYGDATELKVDVPLSVVDAFLETFVEELSGRGRAVRL